jgi:hypothetical protein
MGATEPDALSAGEKLLLLIVADNGGQMQRDDMLAALNAAVEGYEHIDDALAAYMQKRRSKQ